jgi:hypothetical protein
VPATHGGVHDFFTALFSDMTDAVPEAGINQLADIMTSATVHKNATVRFVIQGDAADLIQFYAHSQRLTESELQVTVYSAHASVEVPLFSTEKRRVCKRKTFDYYLKCHDEQRLVRRAAMTAAEAFGVSRLLEDVAQKSLAERHGLLIADAVDVSAVPPQADAKL